MVFLYFYHEGLGRNEDAKYSEIPLLRPPKI